MLCTGRPEASGSFIPWFCHTENPQGWEWHLPQAPIVPWCSHSCHSSGRSTGVALSGAAKVTPGCPQGPELPAGHSATCAAHAQDPWSPGGIRAGQGAFHCCFSAKQQEELCLNLGTRGSSCSSCTLQSTAGAGAALPQGRMELGHRLAPCPAPRGRQMETAWREAAASPHSLPQPPQMTQSRRVVPFQRKGTGMKWC